MTDNLRAPVQGYSAGIPWSLHLRAWDRYAEKYGRSQSAKRLAERGGFGVSELDVFVPGWRDEVSEITRLQEALAAAETEREWLAKLQSALAFWMPSVTEAIEIELNGRAGDDAYLLAGFDGEVPVPSWGDKAISRAEAAEAKLASLPALLAETRKKALEEAAAIENRPPRTLGEAMLESPFKAVERYRAAIRALSQEQSK